MSVEATTPGLEALLNYLKESRGFDFTGYKRPSLERRIRKRMELVGIEKEEEYLDHLQVDPDEFTQLFNMILINVTRFFRDPEIWDYLAAEIVPRILEDRADGPIRVWVPGCASGEEPYSVAMILAERMGAKEVRDRVKIYATDVDEEALSQARQASYTSKQVADVPAPLLHKYFDPSGAGFTFMKELRQAVIFGRHDIVQNAPISKLDLLLCRNTLMYLNADTQSNVLAQFYFALKDSGFLVLGKAEMLFTHVRAFVPFDLKRRVFMKASTGDEMPNRLALLTAAGIGPRVDQITNHTRGREAAFELGHVPQIVVDRGGILVQANDKARETFRLAAADLGRPIQDLEISYRPIELRNHIEKVQQSGEPIVLKDVRWGEPDGARFVDVDFVPLSDGAGRFLGVSVTFTDVTMSHELQAELQQTNQELETAMEELQSTNEELETTNEELQSTNEELETMNEELQSTNEELNTINEEVRERGDRLQQVNLFIDSILSSVTAGVVVLDRDLRVRLWNGRARELWGLTEDEARGQPFLSLDIGLPVARLGDTLAGALRGTDGTPDLRLEAIDRRGRPIVCRIHVSPMRGSGGGLEGVIVTMEDEAATRD